MHQQDLLTHVSNSPLSQQITKTHMEPVTIKVPSFRRTSSSNGKNTLKSKG